MNTLRPALILAALLLQFAPSDGVAEPSHAIAMHGAPALAADFKHFTYVNPAAPKGGRIVYGVEGTFDSLNPFIVQGSNTTARGMIDEVFGNNVFETLMQRSYNEPFTLYPLLAESVETDEARSFVEFTLDPDAHFSDGQPVTADDVVFTLNLLRDKGLPRYAATVKKLSRIDKVGERRVRLTFADPNRELPLILGLFPVLPKHAIDPETFDRTTFTPPLGSGPYRLESVETGRSFALRRRDATGRRVGKAA